MRFQRAHSLLPFRKWTAVTTLCQHLSLSLSLFIPHSFICSPVWFERGSAPYLLTHRCALVLVAVIVICIIACTCGSSDKVSIMFTFMHMLSLSRFTCFVYIYIVTVIVYDGFCYSHDAPPRLAQCHSLPIIRCCLMSHTRYRFRLEWHVFGEISWSVRAWS